MTGCPVNLYNCYSPCNPNKKNNLKKTLKKVLTYTVDRGIMNHKIKHGGNKMLGEARVNELIKKFSIRYGVRNGVEGLEVHSPKGITPAIDKEIKENKPEILEEVRRIKEKRDRKIAEEEAKAAKEEKELRRAYLSGEKKFELIYKDHDGFPTWNVSGKVERELLGELGLTREVGYTTKLKDEAEEILGHEFTYQEACEYANPINEAKAAAKVEREKKEEKRVAEIFATAKKTGKPQELSHWTDDCNDPSEECSTDIVHLYAMPDGTAKKTRQHTW